MLLSHTCERYYIPGIIGRFLILLSICHSDTSSGDDIKIGSKSSRYVPVSSLEFPRKYRSIQCANVWMWKYMSELTYSVVCKWIKLVLLALRLLFQYNLLHVSLHSFIFLWMSRCFRHNYFIKFSKYCSFLFVHYLHSLSTGIKKKSQTLQWFIITNMAVFTMMRT